ncbi:NtaA/DmoA family FMN-dependent monooxygenase [Microbacterium sp. GXF0217]
MSARRPLILGAMVRTIGAYPSGWRHPDAHDDPTQDAEILREIARIGEDAGLDYLFFGDWLATGPDLEFVNPYLLARIDPVSAVTYLAGVTSRIGLIATVNTTYADAYTFARSSASADVLSHGRVGVNLVTGAEPRAAGNHGRDLHADNATRYDRAEEFVTAVRRLWESWSPHAWIADKDGGRLIDPDGLRAADLDGEHIRVTGPLNTARPPQGQLPIVHAGTSERSRALAARHADLALIGAPTAELAAAARVELRAAAIAAGRDADDIRVIAPVLPVVAETTAQAQAIVDELLALVPLDEGGEVPDAFPENRSLASLAAAFALDLDPTTGVDDVIAPEQADALPDAAAALVRRVQRLTGRSIGGAHALTWRPILALWAVPAAFVVGTGAEVADHLAQWYASEAVDGFNVLSAYQPGQFRAFVELVVPELRRRGLLSDEAGQEITLRGRLGLRDPVPAHAPQPA